MILSAFIPLVRFLGIVDLLIQEPLAAADQQLGPILEPKPVKFSFDTPGWYFLGMLFIFTCLFLIFKGLKRYKQNAYRREALKKINFVSSSKPQKELKQQVSELFVILKIAAFKAYGRDHVASLYGKSWLLFLESKAKNTPFTKYEPIISGAIYKDFVPDAQELNELKNLSKKWIQTHA